MTLQGPRHVAEGSTTVIVGVAVPLLLDKLVHRLTNRAAWFGLGSGTGMPRLRCPVV